MQEIKVGEENLVFCGSDEINKYDDIKNDFMKNILGLDTDACFLTDISDLSDFALEGMPEDVANRADSLEATYSIWDQWVMLAIMKRYGIIVKDTRVSLVSIFSRIDDHFSKSESPTFH